MKNKLSFFILALVILGLAGCGGDSVKPEGADVEERDVRAGGLGEEYGPDGQPIGGMRGEDLLSQRRVYFEFDSSALDAESRAIVEAHAMYLVDNPDVKVVMEGHADERGTREYNLALGERRGKTVAQLMQDLGVMPQRITTISYGEEKPVALGHNESAWRLNRRVEILYGNY